MNSEPVYWLVNVKKDRVKKFFDSSIWENDYNSKQSISLAIQIKPGDKVAMKGVKFPKKADDTYVPYMPIHAIG